MQTLAAVPYDWQRHMRIGAGIAMSGEMLQGRQHARVLKSTHDCGNHRRGQMRVAAKRTPPDNRIVGIGFQISNRRKIHRNANRSQFLPNRLPESISQLGVACRRDQHRRGKFGKSVPQMGNQAALLIYSDQQRQPARVCDGVLEGVGQRSNIFWSTRVAAKQRQRPWLPASEKITPYFRQLRAVEADHKHLPDALFQSQGLQERRSGSRDNEQQA